MKLSHQWKWYLDRDNSLHHPIFPSQNIIPNIIYIKKKKKKKKEVLFVIYHSWVRYFPWQYFSRLTTLFGISSLCVSENCKFSSLIPLRKYCIQMKIGQSESRTLFPCILRSIFLATVDSIFHLITVETFMKRHKRKNYRLIFLSLSRSRFERKELHEYIVLFLT